MFNHHQNQKISAIDGGEVSTSRLEILTDGIFAVAMTLQIAKSARRSLCP